MRGIFTTSIFLLIVFSISAQSIISIKDGNWSDPDTWNLNRIPISSDFVKINHTIALQDAGTIVDRMEISNYGGNDAKLNVDIVGSFEITEHLDIFGGNANGDSFIFLNAESSVQVGSIYIRRNLNNETSNSAGIGVFDESSLTCIGGFVFEYDGTSSNEDKEEIAILNNGEFVVKGDVNVNINSGKEFSFSLYDSS